MKPYCSFILCGIPAHFVVLCRVVELSAVCSAHSHCSCKYAQNKKHESISQGCARLKVQTHGKIPNKSKQRNGRSGINDQCGIERMFSIFNHRVKELLSAFLPRFVVRNLKIDRNRIPVSFGLFELRDFLVEKQSELLRSNTGLTCQSQFNNLISETCGKRACFH